MKNNIKNKNLTKKIIYVAGIVSFLALVTVFCFKDFKNVFLQNVWEQSGVSNVTTQNYDNKMSVHFLNVGKADCALIECADTRILIDAADKEPTGTVVEYLKRRNIEKFDLVVASHPHRDHIGQMADVIREFKVDKFIEPPLSNETVPTTASYENMLKALTARKVKVKTAKAGESFRLGDMKIDILGPISNNSTLNNNSVVLKITFKKVSFLFTGDCEKIEEKEILKSGYNLKSNVLKVAHHGSNTSSTFQFLKKINPDYAVISVGSDRSNLPKEKVLERLKKFCNEIYRTDQDGTILFLTDGEHIEVKCHKED